jgi:tripeptide aminopeptidase
MNFARILSLPFAAALALTLAAPALPGSGRDAEARQCDPRANPHCADVQRLAADPRVQRALAAIEQNRDRARADLIELTEIEAPPFAEERRARRYLEMLREAGADSVWIDDEGNAIGLVRGASGERTVVIEGHLDTVFPEGTDVRVRERGDTLFAPGIADDTRGTVAVLHVLHGMTAAGLRPQADVLFIGTVGEEGLGDLRGVKHLFREGARPIDSYIAVEPGAHYLTTGGIGSHRYRVTFHGPGGHSWGAFGTANPIHALGRAIRIFDDRADAATRGDGPRTTYNVGRIGGGTSVNSVAFAAWLEVDMRSEDDASLNALDAIFQESVQQALAEQNRLLRRGEQLTVEVEMVGQRPSGTIAHDHPLIRRGEAVIRHFGGEPTYRSGSTNSNVPFSLGVPAVTIGAGGRSGDAHALTEWWYDEGGRAHESVQQALLLLLLEAGLAR